jgi:hypothetical protein
MSMPETPPKPARPRLLLVGAGKREIGAPAWSADDAPCLDGATLPWLMDGILDELHASLFPLGERRFEVVDVIKFDDIRIFYPRPRTLEAQDGDALKVQRAMFLAEQRNLDGVVVLIDRERKDQPDRAARMRNGKERFRMAGGKAGLACAVGAACRSVETWLLADPLARQTVFGLAAENPFSVDPEERPAPDELKKYIAESASCVGISEPTARTELAKAARPAELRSRCASSYPPFADDVAAEIGNIVA